MKTILKNLTLSVLALFLLSVIFTACKKSSSSVAPPTPLGGYTSSDDVASANLVAYWPFDGNANETKGASTATTVGATFNTGIRGQAYQGAAGAYATLTPGAAFSSLSSYSFSIWYKLPSQVTATQGMFFLAGTTNLDEMIYEVESYPTTAHDSVRVHHGFNDLGSPAYQLFVMQSFDTTAVNQWVHLVTTYDGGSSTYTIYENGVAIGNQSAFSSGGYVTPTKMWTDGTMTTPLGNLSFASDPPKKIYIGTWPPTLFGVSPTLGANGSFLGQLDELRIFNKALSSSEVVGLYLNGKAGR